MLPAAQLHSRRMAICLGAERCLRSLLTAQFTWSSDDGEGMPTPQLEIGHTRKEMLQRDAEAYSVPSQSKLFETSVLHTHAVDLYTAVSYPPPIAVTQMSACLVSPAFAVAARMSTMGGGKGSMLSESSNHAVQQRPCVTSWAVGEQFASRPLPTSLRKVSVSANQSDTAERMGLHRSPTQVASQIEAPKQYTPADGIFGAIARFAEDLSSTVATEIGAVHEHRPRDCTASVARLIPDFVAALCFCAGHGDLLAAIALACVNRDMKRVLSPWLHKLQWAVVRPQDPVSRLLSAADAACALRLHKLRIGSSWLDVRWLQAAASSRRVLDLRGTTNGAASTQIYFALTAVACHICQSGIVSRVILHTSNSQGCNVELRSRTLDLSKRGLGDDGCSCAAGVLAGTESGQLRDLLLAQNKLTNASMLSLTAAIASGRLASLRTLRLSNNRLGSAGLRALANVLVSGGNNLLPMLAIVHMDGNAVGNAGAAALADALASGSLPMLEELGLGRNGISLVLPFVRAIASGGASQLRRLLLQGNDVTDDSLRALQDAMVTFRPLRCRNSVVASEHEAAKDEFNPAGRVAVRLRRVF